MLIQRVLQIMHPRIRKEMQLTDQGFYFDRFMMTINEHSPRRLRNTTITAQVYWMPQSNAMGSCRIRRVQKRYPTTTNLCVVIPSNGANHLCPQHPRLPESLQCWYGRRQQPVKPVLFQNLGVAILTHHIPFVTRLPDGSPHNTDLSVGRSNNYHDKCNVSRTFYPNRRNSWHSYAKCRNFILEVHSQM